MTRCGLVALGFALLVLVSVRPAPAQIDLTGEFGLQFLDLCNVTITQNGTLIDFTFVCVFMQAVASGTIDPVTGVFSGTGGCTVGPGNFGGFTITGTAAPDSSSFEGGLSCPPAIPGGPYAYVALRRCPATPTPGCRTAGKSLFVFKGEFEDAKGKLLWKWLKGEATAAEDFGLPTGTAGYTLCIYAGALTVQRNILPSSTFWQPIGDKGWKYKDSSGSVASITKVVLKGGDAGKSKVLVKGKGPGVNFYDFLLPVQDDELPITVQLTRNATNFCWASTFTAADVKVNTSNTFKAKNESP